MAIYKKRSYFTSDKKEFQHQKTVLTDLLLPVRHAGASNSEVFYTEYTEISCSSTDLASLNGEKQRNDGDG